MFVCWELSSSTTPSSSSVLHLGKLIRKPRCSFLWEPEVQTKGAPAHMWEPTSQPTPTHKKNASQPTSYTLPSHFWVLLGACPALPRKAHYVNDKQFHHLLVRGGISIISLEIQTKFCVRGPSGFCVVIIAHLHCLNKASRLR